MKKDVNGKMGEQHARIRVGPSLTTSSFFACWLCTSHQHSFSYIGTGLPGLNQY